MQPDWAPPLSRDFSLLTDQVNLRRLFGFSLIETHKKSQDSMPRLKRKVGTCRFVKWAHVGVSFTQVLISYKLVLFLNKETNLLILQSLLSMKIFIKICSRH